MAAQVTVATFDCRILPLDGDAQHHEEILWNSKRVFRPFRSRFAPTDAHRERCAREAAEAKLHRKCIDCGLQLYSAQAKRCQTCAANRREEANRMRSRQRVHRKFVGHHPDYPDPR